MLGPGQSRAHLAFGDGVTVIHGPSNTGKSYILAVIDYMLGGDNLKRQPPEAESYDRILLGLVVDDATITLSRSPRGGGYKIFEGDFRDGVGAEVKPSEEISTSKLRNYLGDLLGFGGIQLRKNAKNQTKRLTLRSSLPLVLIQESAIYTEYSPYTSPQQVNVNRTYERSRLRYFLTGADDSELVADETAEARIGRQTRLSVLEELRERKADELKAMSPDGEARSEFDDQRERLSESYNAAVSKLVDVEEAYKVARRKYRDAADQLDLLQVRDTEIESMVARFQLLLDQYVSDIERLTASIEAGVFFQLLPEHDCPVCGAEPASQLYTDHSHPDLNEAVTAMRAELSRTQLNRKELEELLGELTVERAGLVDRIDNQADRVSELRRVVRNEAIPMRDSQQRFQTVFEKRSEVESIISLFDELNEFDQLIAKAEQDNTGGEGPSVGDLPTSRLDRLSQQIETLLEAWGLESPARVHFDPSADDFVICGKARRENGKGYRALTYAAAVIALRIVASRQGTWPFEFTVLDSPLLAYEQAEDAPKDSQSVAIAGSQTNRLFFESLVSLGGQFIVFDNERALPTVLPSGLQSIDFSGQDNEGRYGFFPLKDNI